MKIDSQQVLCGKSGIGKTSLARELLVAHAKAGAMVFVMDVNKQFADLFPWFATVAHYAQANRKLAADGKQLRCASIGSIDSEELTDFVNALALQLENAAANDNQPKGRPPYIALCYDEVKLIKGMRPGYTPPKMAELIVLRRHRGVALMALGQHFGMLPPDLQENATDLYLFKTSSEERIKTCAKKFGLQFDHLKSALDGLPMKYGYLHIREEAFVGTRLK